MEIKTIQPVDYKDVLALNKELLDHYQSKGIVAWEITENDLMKSLDQKHSIIARDDQQMAGYLLSFDLESKTDFPKPILKYLRQKISLEILEKVRVCIGQVCVSKDYRRQGIAEKMYQEFLLNNTNYDLRLMDIDKDYKASKRLHQKIGAIHACDLSLEGYSSVFAFVLHNKAISEQVIYALRA